MRKLGLIAEHGPDMRLPDLGRELAADCPRAKAASLQDRCDVRYPALVSSADQGRTGPAPARVTQANAQKLIAEHWTARLIARPHGRLYIIGAAVDYCACIIIVGKSFRLIIDHI